MRIASTAKAFSGAVALSLVSKGTLSLNDTIGEFLSDLPKPPPDAWARGYPQAASQPHQRPARLLREPGLPESALERAPHKHPGRRSCLLTCTTISRPALRSRFQVPVFQLGQHSRGPDGRGGHGQDLRKPAPKAGLRAARPEEDYPAAGPNLREPYIHGYDLSEDPPEDGSEALAAGWAWASGGIVSTPADLNTFIRAYVRGDLFDLRTRAKQRRVIEGGGSEPPGPGKNSAGLGVFRYETSCGTVWGHTGNIPAATPSSWPPAQTGSAPPRCP